MVGLEEINASAKALLRSQKYDEALRNLESELVKQPNQLDLLNLASDICRASGDYSRALDYAQRLVAHHPHDWSGYLREAQDRLALGQFHSYVETPTTEPCQPPSDPEHHRLWKTLFAIKANPKREHWLRSHNVVAPHQDDHDNNQNACAWQPFQYWSQGKPPEQIQSITSIWNNIFTSIGISPIKLFNKDSALAYIKNHCPELVISFTTAFHYAIEADVFRVAYAQKNDCIWLDSDLYPQRYTKHLLQALLLSGSKTTLMFRWNSPRICNGFFISPSSSIFFSNLLESTKEIDFRSLPKNKHTVISTFGPWRYNTELEKIIEQHQSKCSDQSTTRATDLEGITFVNDHTFAYVTPPYSLDYKTTSASWQNSIP